MFRRVQRRWEEVSDIHKFMGSNLEKYGLQRNNLLCKCQGRLRLLLVRMTLCLGKQETAFSAKGVPRRGKGDGTSRFVVSCYFVYLSPTSRVRARSTTPTNFSTFSNISKVLQNYSTYYIFQSLLSVWKCV